MKKAPEGLLRTPIVNPQSGTIDRSWWAHLNTDQFSNLPVFANNAAAKAGKLNPGDYYRTGGDPDILCVVH